MRFKQPAIVLAAAVLCAAADPTPVAAQQPVNCVDLYNRVMAVYQTAPLSPEYNQMAAAYSATCLAGASAARAYPAYYPRYYPNITRPNISPTTDMPNRITPSALCRCFR